MAKAQTGRRSKCPLIPIANVKTAPITEFFNSLGYFRLFSTRAHNVRYTSESRPMAAKFNFSAVFVSFTPESRPDSDEPSSAGVDPQETFPVPAGAAYFSFSKSAFTSFSSSVSKPSQRTPSLGAALKTHRYIR